MNALACQSNGVAELLSHDLNRIGAILDYAAEADVAEEGSDDASSPPIAEADLDPEQAELEAREHSAYGITSQVHEARKKRAVDDRVGVTQARV